jgi:hypothetical protein
MGVVLDLRSKDDRFLQQMVSFLIRNSKPVVLSSGTKKAQEVADASSQGYKSALMDALREYGNEQRVQLFAPYFDYMGDRKWIPGLDYGAVPQFVKAILEDWSMNYALTNKSDDEWYDHVSKVWNETVLQPEEIAQQLEERRRNAIKAGYTEFLKPGDREWIEKERNDFASLVQPYDDLLAKLGE